MFVDVAVETRITVIDAVGVRYYEWNTYHNLIYAEVLKLVLCVMFYWFLVSIILIHSYSFAFFHTYAWFSVIFQDYYRSIVKKCDSATCNKCSPINGPKNYP